MHIAAQLIPMRKTESKPKFNSFDEFYVHYVTKLKRDNPDYLRLDGRTQGSNRQPFAYFSHREQLWKVDGDTWIEKLDLAYQKLLQNQDPFKVAPTKGNKNKCLVIIDEPQTKKMFYVYLT